MVSENVEEYLECIWELTQGGEPARTTEIARRMNVSPASVTEMLQKLNASGYVSYEKYRGATLTDEGYRIGSKIKRRHRLLERFLVDILGLEKERSHTEACRLEHMISDESELRISEIMNNPKTCPDGDPIPEMQSICLLVEGRDSRSLSEMDVGSTGIISHLKCDDPKKIRRIISMGFVPDRPVMLEERLPMGGPLLVRIGDCRVALATDYAELVFVRDAGEKVRAHRRSRKGRADV